MIVDLLANRHLYRGLQRRLAVGLEYLSALDHSVPDGRHPVESDAVFALVQSYDTGPATEKLFETHVRHLDIQYLLDGRERILHVPALGLLAESAYDAERDVAFHHDPEASSSVLMDAGSFAIFFPGDAHKPGCMAGGRHRVRKVVVKVRVDD